MLDTRFLKRFTFFSRTQMGVFFIFALFATAIFIVQPVYAAGSAPVVQNLNAVGKEAGLGTASLGQIIAKIIRVFFGILAVVALGLTIFGGFKWMTAAGDEKKVGEAKDILKNGVIGLTIIFSAFGISEFVMSKLFNSAGLKNNGGILSGDTNGENALLSGYNGASAMGTIVQWHDPVRDAINVSRASVIQVKFKFPIEVASLIDGTSKDVQKKDGVVISGPLKAGSVLIYPTALTESEALKPDQVWVTVVADGTDTMFVFDPVPFLGSASQNTLYTVKLASSITRQQPAGASAFSSFSGGYSWQFTVGTKIDTTPPTLVSIVPVAGGTYDRNITVQLTFSEPLNLASAVGLFDPAKNKTFQNIVAAVNAQPIAGVWRAGDGFNIIEFTTLNKCATNSCGQDVFCLPASSSIEVRAKSAILLKNAAGVIENAQLDPKFGYSGVADTSNNALDGGGKNSEKPWSLAQGGTPHGTPDDDFFMNFTTTDATKTNAPSIISLEPKFYASAKSDPIFDVKSPVTATFDTVMKMTTFDDVALRAKNPKAQSGYWKMGANIKTTINKVEQTVTKLTIDHVNFAKNSAYAASVPSSVQDIYQNCFLPAGGLQCAPDPKSGLYSCCNGVAAGQACEKINYGAQ